MKLEPGLYKIEERGAFGKCHYLKVYYEGNKKLFSIDGGIPQEADQYGVIHLDGYHFKQRLTQIPHVKKCRITVEWTDEKGDTFEVSATNVHVIRNLFSEYPEVADAAGANIQKGKRRG